MNTTIFTRCNNPISILKVALIILAYLIYPATSMAANLNLAWDASTSPNVGGYILSYGIAPGKYDTHIDVGTGTNFQASNLQPGTTYYLAVKAYDTTHKTESTYSNEVKAVIPADPVTPPPPALSPEFSVNVQSGNAPLTVVFTDKSTGTITSRLWNFGDGSTSTDINPTHVFQAGTYSVSLTISGSGTSATKTKNAFITASASTSGNPILPDPNLSTFLSNLVAAYGFEENGGVVVADASGQANHATLTGGAIRGTGRFGKAALLDGVNDYILVKDSDSLDLRDKFTLTAWVKPQANKVNSILTKEQNGGAVYALYASKDANMPFSGFNDGSAYRTIQGFSPLPLNTWSHLAAVYDKQYLRLYVNGEQVAARAYSGTLAASTGSLRIGGNSIWGDYFKGLIDEVKIYRAALLPSELQTDMKKAIFASKPKQILIGSNQLESSVDSNPQNVAEAYSIVAAKTGVLTRIDVYLEEGSATSGITAGIYTDNKGHPGKLLTKGKITTTKTAANNAVAVPGAHIEAGKTYWLAVISPNGVIKFRDRMGQAGGSPMEISASSTLTTLPLYWTTGQTYSDGPMSVYGSGY